MVSTVQKLCSYTRERSLLAWQGWATVDGRYEARLAGVQLQATQVDAQRAAVVYAQGVCGEPHLELGLLRLGRASDEGREVELGAHFLVEHGM